MSENNNKNNFQNPFEGKNPKEVIAELWAKGTPLSKETLFEKLEKKRAANATKK